MKFKFEIIFQPLGDFYLAVPVGPGSEKCGNCIQINESTYFITSRIKQGLSIEEIASEFMEEYEIDHDSAIHYTEDTIENLRSIGYVE